MRYLVRSFPPRGRAWTMANERGEEEGPARGCRFGEREEREK